MDRRELRRLKEQLALMDENLDHCEQTMISMRAMRKDIKRRILNLPITEAAEPPLKSVRD